MADRNRIWPYDVRYYPAPVPSAGVFDAPQICIRINEVWARHVDSVVERLLRLDAWKGTDEERQAAVDAANVISALLNKGGECMTCSDETFEIIDGHLWRTCPDEEPADLGQVVGADGLPGSDGMPGGDGSDGTPGSDGSPVQMRVSDGYIQWKLESDVEWINLQAISELVGAQGEQGISGTAGYAGGTGEPGVDGRSGIDGVNVPAPTETPSDGLRCSIALNLAHDLRVRWTKLYSADSTDYVTALATGAGTAAPIIAILFPEVALAAAGVAILLNGLRLIAGAINAGEINNFDDAAEVRIRGYFYCELDNTGDFTPTQRAAVVEKIRADTDFVSGYNDFIADFLDVSPIDALRWVAWTSSAISPDACEEFECTGDVAVHYTSGFGGIGTSFANFGRRYTFHSVPRGDCHSIDITFGETGNYTMQVYSSTDTAQTCQPERYVIGTDRPSPNYSYPSSIVGTYTDAHYISVNSGTPFTIDISVS